jgi:putative two-component system response regulator
MVVDDEPANLNLIRRLLQRQGYENVVAVQDARCVLPLFQAAPPDLLILDLHMPYMSGVEVLRQVRAVAPPGDYLPVLVLTGDTDLQARREALQASANDFLNKPFDVIELRCRVSNLLDARRLHRRLAGENERLEAMVQERTRELAASQEHLLDCLALASDVRDDDTREHTHRVGDLAAAIAAELGRPNAECEMIRRAARLHDVGKIGVPDAILLKPGPLTPAERERMQEHTVFGSRMFAGAEAPLIRLAAEISRSHHEQWAGGGYPDGLSGESIPLPARIVSVADVFDALSHDRPYRPAWPHADVLRELTTSAGTRYDPAIVAALLRVLARGHAGARGARAEERRLGRRPQAAGGEAVRSAAFIAAAPA